MKIASIELYELRVPLKKPFTRSKKIGTLVDCTPSYASSSPRTGWWASGKPTPSCR